MYRICRSSMLAVPSEQSDTEERPLIGIVGGTILLERQALADARALTLETPYGTADLDLGTLAATGCPVPVYQPGPAAADASRSR